MGPPLFSFADRIHKLSEAEHRTRKARGMFLLAASMPDVAVTGTGVWAPDLSRGVGDRFGPLPPAEYR
jgi:hypothetical protein